MQTEHRNEPRNRNLLTNKLQGGKKEIPIQLNYLNRSTESQDKLYLELIYFL